jgi:hypothetical protein
LKNLIGSFNLPVLKLTLKPSADGDSNDDSFYNTIPGEMLTVVISAFLLLT